MYRYIHVTVSGLPGPLLQSGRSPESVAKQKVWGELEACVALLAACLLISIRMSGRPLTPVSS